MFQESGAEKVDVSVLVDFGTYLRRLRMEQRLSQSELAERANMSVEAISALERGVRKRLQAGTIDLLGTALGASMTTARYYR